jgi:hypothetical protein
VNGTHQFLVHADDSNIVSESINSVKNDTEALSEVNRKVNTGKINYVFMSRHQNAR